MRNQPRKGRLGGARQDEEQPGSQGQDAESNRHGKYAEARVEILQTAACGDRGAIDGAADFARGERCNGEQEIEREEEEEIEIDGENRRRQQFQEGDDCGIQIIAIALGGQDLHYREEEQQMHRGGKKIARQQKVVGAKKRGVGDGDDGCEPVGEVEMHQPANQDGAQHQARGGQRNGGRVQVARTCDCQVAAGHQPEQ